jgi:hypothetical protein
MGRFTRAARSSSRSGLAIRQRRPPTTKYRSSGVTGCFTPISAAAPRLASWQRPTSPASYRRSASASPSGRPPPCASGGRSPGAGRFAPRAADRSRGAGSGYGQVGKPFRKMNTGRRFRRPRTATIAFIFLVSTLYNKPTRHQTGAVECLLHGADSPPIKAPDIPRTASKVSQSQFERRLTKPSHRLGNDRVVEQRAWLDVGRTGCWDKPAFRIVGQWICQ